MELFLTNYQSWSEASLKLEGVTVVVGPSNRGKSSFTRAIKGALRNEIGPQHIKLGTTEGVEVRLLVDGHSIVASRGIKAKDSLVYNVDGQDYSKLQGGVPDTLEALKFGTVTVNGTTIDPIFAVQLDAQFLLGSSPAEFNNVLNGFASTEKLDRGRKVLASDINAINATAKALSPRISQEQQQVAELTERCARVEALQAEVNTLAKTVDVLERATSAVQVLSQAITRRVVLVAQLDALEALQASLATALTGYKKARQAALAHASTTACQSLAVVIAALEKVKAVAVVALTAAKAPQAIAQVVAAQTRTATLVLQQSKIADAAQATAKALVLYKASFRIALLRQLDPTGLRAQAAHVADLSNQCAVPEKFLLASIMVQKVVHVLAPAAQATQDTLTVLDGQIQDLKAEQTSVEASIEQLRAAAVTCPKCGNEFIPSHSHT